jgi:multidrug efflux pump subunit AcrB
VNRGTFRVRLCDPAERKRSQQDIADYLSRSLKKFSSTKIFVNQEQTISASGGGARSGMPIRYVLQAPTYEKLQQYLPVFMDEVSNDPTFEAFDVDLKFNKPELIITPDRERARALNVSIADIAQTLGLAFSGSRFAYFNIDGKQYQVIGQFTKKYRDEPLDLEALYVKNSDGMMIQMDNLVNVTETISPPQLYHYNRYRSATVSATPVKGKTIGEGIEAMDAIAKRVLDPTFMTTLSGASRDYAESSSNITFAFILALVLIYLILSAQFESFIDPLIIMFTVPLAMAGALLTLTIFGQTLNVFSEIGIIVLIGLVTKNGILIVEFANQKREIGLPMIEAVREAAASRLRPILMTSLATMLGAGAKSRTPMGMVIIGGLLFSLILTLFVIPAIYTFLSRKRKKIKPHATETVTL